MDTNVTQQKQTDKRYLVNISYYSHQPNDEKAKRTALEVVKAMNKADDCKATVDEISEAPFGKKPFRRIL